MQVAASDAFLTCREALTDARQHRVWSLIITVFGDLAQAPGARLSGAALGAVTDLMGVRPEAMRVALHRLRKDGWIESQREGRASFHCLTRFGREQCAEANPRIYGDDLPAGTPMHLLVADESSADARRALDAFALTEAYLHLGGNILVGLGPGPVDAEGFLVVEADRMQLPGWVKGRVCPISLSQEYHRLHDALQLVSHALADHPTLPPCETAALRTLVVHSWRRVLLRHPNLPASFFPADWPGPACREAVKTILGHLPVDADDLPGANGSLESIGGA